MQSRKVLIAHGYVVYSSDIADYGCGEAGVDYLSASPNGAGAIVGKPITHGDG
jgi:hypothetical protein